MTDAIIQEVFKKFQLQSYGDCASESDVDELLTQLQQELIEKIKQDADFNHYRLRTNTPIGISLKKLIGDNKE